MQDLTPSRVRPGFALAVALLVAAIGATGEVRVAPRLGFLLAAATVAGVLVVLFATRSARRGVGWTWATVVAAAFVGFTAGHVLLAPGMPRVHDLMHPWGIWAYGRAVGEGNLWPRWLPYLGCGIPLLQFYGPLNFLLALPAVLLGFSPVTAFKSVLLFGHTVSPVAGFAGARMLGAGRAGALVTAVALAFAPWRLTNFDYRGALGEATAFVFLPLVAAATLALWKRASVVQAMVLVLALCGLVLTHLLSVFTLFVILVPVLIVQSVLGRNGSESHTVWRAPRVVALAWIVALGLTAAWWVPAVGELGATSVEATTRDNAYYHYGEHGLSARDLAERRAWDQLRGSIPRTTRFEHGEQMPFYAGAVLILLAWSAPWWSRERATWALAVGSFVAVALSTAALAAPAAVLPFFSTVRFPWRFLSPATVLAALALGVGVDGWLRRHHAAGRINAIAKHRALCAILPLAIVAALIWDGAPYAGAADRIPPYQGIVHWQALQRGWTHWEDSMRASPVDDIAGRPGQVVRVRDLALPPSDYDTAIDLFYPGYYEWLSPEVYRLYWRSKDPAALAEAGVGYGFSEGHARPAIQPASPYASVYGPAGPRMALPPGSVTRRPGRIDVRFEPGGDGGRLVVLEQAFPGWRARIDGGPWVDPEPRRGFLSLQVPPDARRVQLVYGYGTAARRAGLATTLSTLLLLAVAYARGRIRRRSHP